MKILLKIVIAIALIVVFAEAGLYILEKVSPQYYVGNESGTGFKAKVVNKFLYERIQTIWSRKPEDRKTILEPPFPVFVNKGFDNKKRMDFIFKKQALPVNLSITAENFLRLNKSKNNFTYTATTNSLGYRDPERSVEKPKNTFRIVLLGSYPAFGHGANDNETYAAVLERELQKTSPMKIEVWNGGRQGGTSIMGYARLVNEVERYKPDLILWDYGWIEPYLGKDRIFHPEFSAFKMFTPVEKAILQVCTQTFFSSFKMCTLSVRKIIKVDYNDMIAGWKESMQLLKKWSVSNNVPVMYLRHKGVTIPSKEYEDFNGSKFDYVDTSKSLVPAPSQHEIDEFWSKENWLTEVGFHKEEVMASEPDLIYFGDGLQYNKLGYNRIGEYLAYVIQSKYPQVNEKKKMIKTH